MTDFELERLRSDADYMHFLLAAGDLLGSSLDYRSTLRDICRIAVSSVADICFLDIGSPVDVEMVGAAHRDPRRTGELEHISSYRTRVAGRPAHPVLKVLDSGQPMFVPVIDDAWIERHASSVEHAAFMRRMCYRSMLVVPVRSLVWGISGALTLVRTDLSSRPYDERAIAFAQDLGRRCGIAIGKARLHSQTRDIAERFQKAALPARLPVLPGYSFDVYYEPAEASLLVGGDWYDAFALPNGNVGISIGDVAGHGIESAALMSSIRNAIRMALVMEHSLAEVLRYADFLFGNEAPEGVFCTAAVAVLQPDTAQLTVASAGHPGPLIWTGSGLQEPLRSAGLPLGCGSLGTALQSTATADVPAGSLVAFYTDGLIEAKRDLVRGEALVREALAWESVRRSARPALALKEAVVAGSHPDDIAILILRRSE